MSASAGQKAGKWKDSEAKCLLHDDILSGAVPKSMAAYDVYNMRPQYQCFEYSKFRTNLNYLREAISKSYRRMQEDCEAYGSDRALLQGVPRAGPQNILWHESKARKLLKHDIDNDMHKFLRPSILHSTRAEYMVFSLEVFRNHIYQEVDSRSKRATRIVRKQNRSGGNLSF